MTAYTVPDALPYIAEEDSRQTSADRHTYDLTSRQVPWGTRGIVIRGGKKYLHRP